MPRLNVLFMFSMFRLNSVSWIELRREELPYYQDETSCGYGVGEDAIQTWNKNLALT